MRRSSLFKLGALLFLALAGTANASILYSPGFEKLKQQTAQKFPAQAANASIGAKLSLDGTQTTDPYPDHTVFANQAAAITWAQGQAAQLGQALGAQTFTVIDPSTDTRYVTLQGYLHDTWQAYLKLFPGVVGNLPEPQVILVQTEVVNALVMPDLSTGKIGHAVWVFSALVDAAGGVTNRDIYTGLFGHELAHSVFRHLLPQYQTFYSRYYQPSAQPAAQFGYQATNDTNLETAVTNWENDAALAGYADWSQLDNLPSAGGGFLSVIGALESTDFADASQPCQTALAALQMWANSPGYGISVVYQVPELSSTLQQLEGASDALIAQMKACTTQASIEANKQTLETIAGIQPGTPGAPDVSVFQNYDSAPDSTDGLLNAVAPFRTDMISLDAEIQFPTLRWFSYEEHADTVSAIVNYQMSLDKTSDGPLALNTAFDAIVVAVGADPTELASCQAAVTAGTPQSIGIPEDPHHDICYRLANVAKLSSTMEANPSGYSAFAADFLAKSTPPGGF